MLLANKNFPLIGPSRTGLIGTLAALIFAAHCAGAPGTPMITGFTTSANGPGGFISDGTRVWATDAAKGFCRMDPAGGGGGGGFALTNCILPPTSVLGIHAVLGQPVFDIATQFVYLPDMSAGSKGIWRYHFNGTTFDTGVNIAATFGLGGQRPGAVAIGDDGNLYVSMTANNTFQRVNQPTGLVQTVDKMGTTVSGAPARGLAFVNTALWIADTDGVLLIPGAALCATKCRGAINVQVGVPNILSIAWDAANSEVYMGTAFGVFQYNRVTGQAVLYSKHWQTPAPPAAAVNSGLLTDVTAVGVDTLGNLYYVNDPTGSQTVNGVGAATVYSVPANSLPDGQGTLGSPAPTVPPLLSSLPPFANNAQLYSTGLTTPTGAVFMGTHVWVTDAALGFCKVNPALPAPSLTACAALPVGFVPGQPAYDKATNLVYLADTVGGGGIVRLTFVPATETLAAAGIPAVTTVTTVVPNTALVATVAGATAPTALAVGPDGHLYVAMAGTNQLLRVTTPAGLQHKVSFIGPVFDNGPVSIAFHNSDLWATQTASVAVLYNATLCQGNCIFLFFGISMQAPPLAVTSDGANVYIGDGQRVMKFDPITNLYSPMADTGMLNGVPTSFSSISGLAADGLGHIFAADAGPMWLIAGGVGAAPTITSLSPTQAPESSTNTVTITGTNFLATSLVVSTCASGAISEGNVTVVSPTQITATFAINPVGPLGACNITVTTTGGASAASAGSSFTVLIGPPALTGITPNSGFRGHAAVPVSIAGANMGLGTINPIPGITISNTVVNAAGTVTTANFLISGTATLGPQNVIMSTPSGPSNPITFTINAAPPVLNPAVSPSSGVANSTVAVALTGTDLFQATVNPPAGFTISGTPVVTATSVNVTFIIASTVAAGPQSITVTGPGGISNAVTFTILPKLTGIAPSSARAGDTTNLVTLSGTSLAGVTSVTGANITVSNIVATAGTVTATFTSLSSAPVGPVSVTVTDINGTSNAVTFTLIGPIPVITSMSPQTGGTGATIPLTITGTGLTFGSLNLPAGITVVGTPVSTFSQLTANILIAGNAPLGAQSISVTTPGAGNTSNAVSFTVFQLSPLLNTIAPATSAANTTTTVTLTGQGFTGTTSVNTVPGAGITVSGFTINSGSQITATFVIALNATTQQISVTNPNGTSNPVTFGIVPTLSSISPNSKPASLSVPVTLTGTSLTGATSINAGANIVVSNLVVVSSTQITATFAIAAAAVQGNRNITVTTPGGTTNAQVFNVQAPPPLITQISGSPFTRGSNNQGVTVAGTNMAVCSCVSVFLNGSLISMPVSSTPVAGAITIQPGSIAFGATQLRWNWTIPTSFPASSATQVYTMTVTTQSGTTAPVGFTVQ